MSKSERVQTSTLPPGDSKMALTAEHLLDTPLPELLAELDVTLDESPITDPGFTGSAVVTRDRVVLSMRSGQPHWERTAVARALLGRALNVPLSPLRDALTDLRMHCVHA
ncbi:hypothetical protein [Streptomyces sp. NPDC047079]|uniref:hypothetical protein n=1 Tax=Streptomyces sp. NPDC047079 TaxID=3154607 RepID=UPI0033EE1500